MTGPWFDFLIFDWVLLAGSTVSASECLSLPQSTVSRRFRSFCSEHHVAVRRHDSSYSIISGSDYVEQMRILFARYRVLSGEYIWAIHGPFDSSIIPRCLPGFAISLDDQLFANYSRLLSDLCIDIVYRSDYLDPADDLPFISSDHITSNSLSCLDVLQFRGVLKHSFLDSIQNF